MFPPSNLVQFPARAEPPEFPTLPPPPPAPPQHQSHDWAQDIVAELGVYGWLVEELQYLMPWEVRAATPDQFPETPSVDKFPFRGEMPPIYYELEPVQQDSAQAVLAWAPVIILVPMWERPFSVHQWELEEPVYTESYLELTMSVYPADPAAQLRPWEKLFDDPMLPEVDLAAWQEYAKLDLTPAQQPEFIEIADYWQGWELPPAYPVDIEAAAQETGIALLSPFYAGQTEFVFVVDYQMPFEMPLWPVDDFSSLSSETAQVVNPPVSAIMLFVTPQLEGGFRFSRL